MIRKLLAWLRPKGHRRNRLNIDPPSNWQSVFMQSPANGGQPLVRAREKGASLMLPVDTWLERRREALRKARKAAR